MEDKFEIERVVNAHNQLEHMTYEEIIPAHIDRGEASQTVFNNAKNFLKMTYGGERCIVCEMRDVRRELAGHPKEPDRVSPCI